MQSDRQERISQRAYQIWVAEGRVHGRHEEHWRRAEHEIAEEELRLAAAMADRAAGTARTSAKPEGATAAGKPRAPSASAPRRRGMPAGSRAS